MTKSSIKNVTKTVLKILFAVALIYWMIRKGALDLNVFKEIASVPLIAFCLGCVLLQVVINNYRWLILLRAQNFESSVGRTLPLSFISLFFSFVMPGGVGGDVMKGYYLLQDHPKQKFAAVISIFMDRMVGFFVMVATTFFALFFNWNDVSHSRELQSVAVAVTLLFTAFIVFFSLSLSRRISQRVLDSWIGRLIFERMPGAAKLRRIYENVHAYRNKPSAFFIAIALSVVNQLLIVAFIVAIANAMGVEGIPLMVYFFLVPVGIVVLALPISPAGIGVGQAAFYFLFSLYLGKSSQLGPTAVTAMQIINFAWGLVGAYFYLHRKRPDVPADAVPEGL